MELDLFIARALASGRLTKPQLAAARHQARRDGRPLIDLLAELGLSPEITGDGMERTVATRAVEPPEGHRTVALHDGGSPGEPTQVMSAAARPAGVGGEAPTREAPPFSAPPSEETVVTPAAETVASDDASGPAGQGLEVPQRLGPYEIGEPIGEGGMGVVYRATHAELATDVAVKFLRGSGDHERFLREARAMAAVSHPGIVGIHHVDLTAGTPYIVMDLVSGKTLAEAIAAGEVAPRRALALAERLAEVLHHAHERGVVHRDLKPSNVMLVEGEGDGGLRVMDFGLAQRHRDSRLTHSGSVIGTPSYMAPEQASGLRDLIGPVTDVYGIGAILYEMLTGFAPFVGESIPEVLFKVVSSEPLPPRLLNPAVGRLAEAICLKAMDKSPARRYASAAEMAADLRAYREGKPVKARPIGPLGRTWRWVRRHRLASAAIGVAAALVGVLAFLAWAPGSVRIEGAPEGAQLSIDMGELEPVGDGVRWLRPGYHKLELRGPNHEPEAHDVYVQAGVSRTLAARSVPSFGQLVFAGRPHGAVLRVRRPDGSWRMVGPTAPSRPVTLDNGLWELELAQAGYVPARFERVIHGGETTTLERDLEPQRAEVSIEGGPGEVAFELTHESGEVVRFTSRWQRPLRVGRHRVRATRQNHFPRETALEVIAGPDAAAERRRNLLRVLLAPRTLWRFVADGAVERTVAVELTGDGILDLVLVTRRHRVHAVDGFFGHPLWSARIDGRPAGLWPLGDVDGDGRPELLIRTRLGRLFCLGGKGDLRWTRRDPVQAVARVADLDGDGVGDLAVSADGEGLEVLAAASGRSLRTLPLPVAGPIAGHARGRFGEPQRRGFVILLRRETGVELVALGATDAAPLWRRVLALVDPTPLAVGDLDGDGASEVVLAGGVAGAPAGTASQLVALDGRSGEVRWLLPVPGRITGRPAVAAHAADRPARVAVASWARQVWVTDHAGRAQPPRRAPSLVAAPVALGDLDGDGRLELIYGAANRELVVTPVDPPEDGADDVVRWTFAGDGELLGMPVLADLDADGRPELIAGLASGSLVAIRGQRERRREPRAGDPAGARPEALLVGVPHYLAKDQMHKQFAPLMKHLSAELGIPCRLLIVNYAELLDALTAGRCNVAILSPLAYVLARRRVPDLIQVGSHVANGRATFRGLIVVKDDSRFRRLEDLHKTTFAYVEPDSTSGCLYPQALLLTRGHAPQRFFSKVVYSGGHDKTIALVRSGQVDAGAIYDGAWLNARLRGIDTGDLRVIATTEPIPYDAYVARPDVPADLVRALESALLRLDGRTPAGRRILGSTLLIDRWVPPDDRRYDGVRRVLRLLERHKIR